MGSNDHPIKIIQYNKTIQISLNDTDTGIIQIAFGNIYFWKIEMIVQDIWMYNFQVKNTYQNILK